MSDSGNKTEQPTPKRLRDARKKGNVAISKDLTSFAGYATFLILAFTVGNSILEFFKKLYSQMTMLIDLPVREMLSALFALAPQVAMLVIAPAVILALASIVGSVMQVGFLFSTESMKFDLNKLNPANNIKKIVSKKNVFDTFKALIKVLIAALVVILIIRECFKVLHADILCTEACFFSLVGFTLGNILLCFFAVFFILSLIDYWVQLHFWTKELMMTKDEVKKEYQDIEGKPEIKQKRKEVQKEILEDTSNRVQLSDAIITNPTHVAIGIYFKEAVAPVPIIVLKGMDGEVPGIKALAREHNVPIVENPPLARQLYESADVDSVVPEELFGPVKDVLMWVQENQSS